ncbi:MAG: pantetheine-phosphate adenylyltransferase [Ignavibacteria bacterium]|nr:pantetheine-phosphate adenylyltransferase [Ignavibacteria bacterium]
MKVALYPGTFDPITNGHLDIVERALKMFDRVIITVARNTSKAPLFTADERLSLIRDALNHNDRVEVEFFDGLLVDFARKRNVSAIVRGLRAVSDFEYEFQMALMNRKLDEAVETVFLMPNEKYTYLNSSIIREIARFGGDVSDFVPPAVQEALTRKSNKG